MPLSPDLLFPPFRLDLVNEQLWRDDRLVPLRPKAFALLRYLAERSPRLVTKEEIFADVWRGTSVVGAGLKVRVAELREALGDDPDTPRFIETVARRGYRFVAPVTRGQAAGDTAPASTGIVGRAGELGRLQAALGRALAGERQVVYVTGEAGIGKTTLVNAFVVEAGLASPVWVGEGRCVERYGAGEAYLPVLEALGGLCRGVGRDRLPALLRQYAPTWLVQLPWLSSAGEREALVREVQGVAQERMLREMADALEVLCAEIPLVLLLEDLHWSDYSTLDLLSVLTRRRGPARLLLVATYRPVDAILSDHPVKQLKQDLTLHGLCEEVALGSFDVDEVVAYLGNRFPPDPPPADLAAAVYRHTDGNPLFLAAVADDLVAGGAIAPDGGHWRWQSADPTEIGVPATIRQLIERQVERLEDQEREMLEAASAVGLSFTSAAVAAALDTDVARCELHCERLGRRGHLLRALGVGAWPDGAPTGQYGFTHAVYRQVLHDGIAPARRIRLHQRLAERTEAAYGERSADIAAELAIHFEEGRDYRRAVHYLQQAAANASSRTATREAVDHLTRAESLLAQLPEGAERMQRELGVHMALGPALMSTRGYAMPEVERAFTRARALCQAMGDPAPLFPVLWGIWGFHVVRGEMAPARALAEQCFVLAEQAGDPEMLVEAHHALWVTRFFCGELVESLAHVERGLALYRPAHRSHVLIYGQDPAVAGHAYGALVSWYVSRPADALHHAEEALALGRAVGHPFSLGFALNFVAWLHYCRGDPAATREHAQELQALATEQGFPFWLAGAAHFAAWAMIEEGEVDAGLAHMRASLAAWRATGANLGVSSYLGRLVEAYLRAGRVAEAGATLVEAMTAMEATGQRYYEPELHRLRGEVVLASAKRESRAVFREAAEAFTAARAVAARQQSQWLDLRAAISLAGLQLRQGETAAARGTLEGAGRGLDDDPTADAALARALRRQVRERR